MVLGRREESKMAEARCTPELAAIETHIELFLDAFKTAQSSYLEYQSARTTNETAPLFDVKFSSNQDTEFDYLALDGEEFSTGNDNQPKHKSLLIQDQARDDMHNRYLLQRTLSSSTDEQTFGMLNMRRAKPRKQRNQVHKEYRRSLGHKRLSLDIQANSVSEQKFLNKTKINATTPLELHIPEPNGLENKTKLNKMSSTMQSSASSTGQSDSPEYVNIPKTMTSPDYVNVLPIVRKMTSSMTSPECVQTPSTSDYAKTTTSPSTSDYVSSTSSFTSFDDPDRAPVPDVEEKEVTSANRSFRSSYHSLFGSFGSLMTPSDYVMGESECALTILDVADVLQAQYAFISGGRTEHGAALLTFPDIQQSSDLTDEQYSNLITYLTSIPSLQDMDTGFTVLLDRRKDKWSNVKKQLNQISGYFPGTIAEVLVLQPSSLFQKAYGNIKTLKKDCFKFKLNLLSGLDDLHKVIEKEQLTSDLGGDLEYNHKTWINERAAVEKFSANTSNIGETLRKFVAKVQETEFPNSVEATQSLITEHEKAYNEVKEDLENIERHGEILIRCFRTVHNKTTGEEEVIEQSSLPPCKLVHIQAVERLNGQLEETHTNFSDFWLKHEKKLAQCLHLREFEESFKLLHSKVLSHIDMLNTMTDRGDSLQHVDSLVLQLQSYEEQSQEDVAEAENLWRRGEDFIENDHYAVDCIRPKCIELQRVCEQYKELMRKQRDLFAKSRQLQERLEKANEWCEKGKDLLATQQLDKFNTSDGAQKALENLELFLAGAHEFHLGDPREFHSTFDCVMSSSTREAVARTMERLQEVTQMCENRRASLKRLIHKPKQTVKVSPISHTKQPKVQKAGISSHTNKSQQSPNFFDYSGNISHTNSSPTPDAASLTLKRGHVIKELIDTEQSYVSELKSIIDGYLVPMETPAAVIGGEMPVELRGMNHILFGNLEEIYRFHSEVFLKDLEYCKNNPAEVGRCFIERKDDFSIYSTYCQNKPASESLISETGHNHPFFKDCQHKLGHKLPLGAYLLKPVQRITKYQLLLKELLKCTFDPLEAMHLRDAIDCMMAVLKYVNDVMHTGAIVGYKGRLSQQGKLLLQGTFEISYENKKDKRPIKEQLSRFKAQQRQVFLYENVVLFCKKKEDDQRMKRSVYFYKSSLDTCSIGLTENVRSDKKKFELWRGQRSEVYVLLAPNNEVKNHWTSTIKQLLQAQFTNIKEREKRDIATVPIKRVFEHSPSITSPVSPVSKQESIESAVNNNLLQAASRPQYFAELSESEVSLDDSSWPSEDSNSDCQFPELPENGQYRYYTALADYNAVDKNEVTMRESDGVELIQKGHQGWWYVRHLTSHHEGWVPASYLEISKRRSTISLQSLNSSQSAASAHSIHSSHSSHSFSKEVIIPATEV